MEPFDFELLVKKAWEASEKSYSPYSNFRVGAAIITKSDTIYVGCNIESIAYGPSNCAERTAFFGAIAGGDRDFSAIAIVGEHANGEQTPDGFTAPCGVCRQVMLEFCDPKTFKVVLGNRNNEYKIYLLEELIPYGFKP